MKLSTYKNMIGTPKLPRIRIEQKTKSFTKTNEGKKKLKQSRNKGGERRRS